MLSASDSNPYIDANIACNLQTFSREQNQTFEQRHSGYLVVNPYKTKAKKRRKSIFYLDILLINGYLGTNGDVYVTNDIRMMILKYRGSLLNDSKRKIFEFSAGCILSDGLCSSIVQTDIPKNKSFEFRWANEIPKINVMRLQKYQNKYLKLRMDVFAAYNVIIFKNKTMNLEVNFNTMNDDSDDGYGTDYDALWNSAQ
eukprot:563180_1